MLTTKIFEMGGEKPPSSEVVLDGVGSESKKTDPSSPQPKKGNKNPHTTSGWLQLNHKAKTTLP